MVKSSWSGILLIVFVIIGQHEFAENSYCKIDGCITETREAFKPFVNVSIENTPIVTIPHEYVKFLLTTTQTGKHNIAWTKNQINETVNGIR